MTFEYWDVVSKKKIVINRKIDDRDIPPTYEEVQESEDIDMTKDEYEGAKWERVFTGGSGWTRSKNYSGRKGEW